MLIIPDHKIFLVPSRSSPAFRRKAACQEQADRSDQYVQRWVHAWLRAKNQDLALTPAELSLGFGWPCSRKPFGMLIASASPVSHPLAPQEGKIALNTRSHCTFGKMPIMLVVLLTV